jgi:hypothetical protein
MDLTDDPRIKELQELKEKLDKENDPQKFPELIDRLMKLLDEIDPDEKLRSTSDPQHR